MTNEECRSLDREIAEKVMGWKSTECDSDVVEYAGGWACVCGAEGTYKESFSHTRPMPHYSTDIAAAWEVVEKLSPLEDEFRLTRFNRQKFACNFGFFNGDHVDSCADSAPLAICLAALKAVGELK